MSKLENELVSQGERIKALEQKVFGIAGEGPNSGGPAPARVRKPLAAAKKAG